MIPDRRQFLTTGIAASCCAAFPSAAAAPVTVFAAASLKAVLDALVADGGVAARVAYGGSGALARQIIQRAPAELYFSAHPQWMDEVEASGRLESDTRVDLLANKLVLITPKGAPETQINAIPAEAKISMGFLQAVPAGQYGKAAFSALGLWARYAPQVVQSDSARAALALVARKELPFGVVYATDALAEPKVQIAATFPAPSHPAIRYPLALVKGYSVEARNFYDHLRSPAAAQVFTQHGFEVI